MVKMKMVATGTLALFFGDLIQKAAHGAGSLPLQVLRHEGMWVKLSAFVYAMGVLMTIAGVVFAVIPSGIILFAPKYWVEERCTHENKQENGE